VGARPAYFPIDFCPQGCDASLRCQGLIVVSEYKGQKEKVTMTLHSLSLQVISCRF
jgi:hypothetical protein